MKALNNVSCICIAVAGPGAGTWVAGEGAVPAGAALVRVVENHWKVVVAGAGAVVDVVVMFCVAGLRN